MARILLFVAIIVGAIVGGAYLTPRHVHVERSVTVYAAPEMIFPYVNDYRRFNDWSPWADRDPNATYEFSGPPAGVGAAMSWSGNDQVGTGSQEITLSEYPSRVETLLDFGAQGTADAYFDLQPTDEGTEVTWGFNVDGGLNPINRYFGLMMDSFVGGDYEEGLMNLRNLVENETSVPRDPDGNPMDVEALAAPEPEETMDDMMDDAMDDADAMADDKMDEARDDAGDMAEDAVDGSEMEETTE